ncbi:uncharacterized protein LOC131574851 [Poecile atricapillus]|uniref:uncharacterized protein LOC131574851 n=1 Tax=Poecile atricapillus TaxID=48891 RepID=UPI0027394E5D|nr:uncharacterized protein LOC131574851 [Poecile atricapillus]
MEPNPAGPAPEATGHDLCPPPAVTLRKGSLLPSITAAPGRAAAAALRAGGPPPAVRVRVTAGSAAGRAPQPDPQSSLRAKASSAFHDTTLLRKLGIHRRLEDTARTTDQRDIPDHMASRSAHKMQGRRRKSGMVWSNGGSQVTITHMTPLSWR